MNAGLGFLGFAAVGSFRAVFPRLPFSSKGLAQSEVYRRDGIREGINFSEVWDHYN